MDFRNRGPVNDQYSQPQFMSWDAAVTIMPSHKQERPKVTRARRMFQNDHR